MGFGVYVAFSTVRSRCPLRLSRDLSDGLQLIADRTSLFVLSNPRHRFLRMFDATSVYPAWMKPACAAALLGVVLGFTVFAFFLPGYAGLAVSIASMGGLMTAVAVAALQTGRVKVDSSASDYGGGTTTVAYRERDPFGFWSSVVLYGVLAALCYGVAVFVLLA